MIPNHSKSVIPANNDIKIIIYPVFDPKFARGRIAFLILIGVYPSLY